MINASNCIRILVCFIVSALCLVAGAPRLAQAQLTATSTPTGFITKTIPASTSACSQGDTILLHLAYSADLAPGRAAPSTVRAFAQFRDSTGRVLFTGNDEIITLGGTRTESVSRRQLAVPQTGPLTLLTEWMISAPGGFGRDLPASAEVVDGCSGRVLFHIGQGLTLQYHPADGDGELAIDLHFTPLSLANEQTLRLEVAHEWVFGVELPTAASQTDFFLEIEGVEGEYSLTQRGNFLPGENIAINFSRLDIPAPGDPGTGRLTVRAGMRYRVRLRPAQLAQMWARGTLPQFPALLQLVDNNDPSALGVLLPAIMKVREL